LVNKRCDCNSLVPSLKIGSSNQTANESHPGPPAIKGESSESFAFFPFGTAYLVNTRNQIFDRLCDLERKVFLISLSCRAILFDMDGTLVDSTACVEAIWERWARKHRIELRPLLEMSHGKRTIDTLQEIAPHLDVELEARALEAEELTSRDGISSVGGALQLLSRLQPHQWAVVTSASRALATVRFASAGLPIPPVLITGDDVLRGKPDPEGYVKAADCLGMSPSDCVAVEDTPAGILAGRSAGMAVLAIGTTFAPEQLLGAPWVPDFNEVEFLID
jgi:mannitol-1-/sugar-/sorbitol-6-phosphatase